MALTFGQILSGAGAIARSTREEQSKQLQLQEQQMRLAELRRLQNEQIAQQQALLQQQAPQMQPIEFRPGLGISQTQPPAPQPQPRPIPSRTDAAELVRMQAAQRQAAEQQAAPTPPTARPAVGLAPSLPSSSVFGGFQQEGIGGEDTLLARMRTGREESRQLREQRQRIREELGPDASAQEVQAEFLRRQQTGVTPPEAQPAAATVVDGIDVEAQETVVQPEYTAELEAPEPEPRTRQAGVSEETNKILGNDSFYLANPNTITREMRTVMNQRQNLVRMAEIYRRSRMGEQYAQALASLQELDNNLLFLQGMEGIVELTQFRDPRRLSAVMRNVTGANIDYQPRDDGRYNLVRYNADGSFNVVQEGLTPQEISNDARLRISAQAREQAAELAADRARRDVELEYFRKQENIKTLNDMAKAIQQGEIDLAKEIAGNAGGSLQETTEGLAFVNTLPTGQAVVSIYDPGRDPDKTWFTRQEIAGTGREPAFVEVPMANSAGLIQTPDVRLAETLQTWNE